MLFVLIAVVIGFCASLYFFPGWGNAGIAAAVGVGICVLYMLFLGVRTHRSEEQAREDAEIASRPAHTAEDIAAQRRHYRRTHKA